MIPSKKWTNRPRLSRKALTSDMMSRRFDSSKCSRELHHTAGWYYNSLVCSDICNTILPTTAKKAAEQTQARKGNKTWASEDSLGDYINLRGDKRHLRMNSWDTRLFIILVVIVIIINLQRDFQVRVMQDKKTTLI